jgi:hypothetical protein
MFGNSAKTKKGIAAHLISTLNFVLKGGSRRLRTVPAWMARLRFLDGA